MHLPGRLSSSTLGDLLGTLHRAAVTGTIELSEIAGLGRAGVAGRVHRLHLRGGLVVAVETALPVAPLGEILRREGLASREVVGQLLRRLEAGDRRRTGEILASTGLASPDAVRAALRAQERERLDALFAIEDARIGFRTARPLPDALRAPPLGPADFLHGRPRLRDRVRGRAPHAGAEAPPRSPSRPAPEDPLDRARRMLDLPRGAGLGDVRRAFRRMAGALHPDRLVAAGADERARHQARFAELSAAYHLLVA